MKNILLLFAGFLLIIILSLITGKIINAYKFKIRSKKGIQKTEYITIGQIQQYIQIRGQDISNPIILMLHGGPGNNMAYYSYYWQADLERDYTIVNWDQRGCGNTYYRNKDAQKPTLDLLLQDLDELVDHMAFLGDLSRWYLFGNTSGKNIRLYPHRPNAGLQKIRTSIRTGSNASGRCGGQTQGRTENREKAGVDNVLSNP